MKRCLWILPKTRKTLGGSSSRFADGRYRDVAAHARSSVLLAAGAYGKSAIDAVFLDIADTAGLDAEARDAAAVGFAATACIHPSQVAVIRSAYAPSADDLEHARDLLAVAESERGVFVFRGAMVDEPLLALARRTLSREASD